MGDHESELATLRARVEELERENTRLVLSTGDHITRRSELSARAEAAEFRLSEATRLAVEALEPFAGAAGNWDYDPPIYESDDRADALRRYPLSVGDFRRARTALDRLTNIMGESDA